MKASSIVPTVDFERDGVQHGYLRLPHSRDDSAWGHVMIPVTVARNGAGPTPLLTSASHGDEYEGPVALMELAYTLDPGQLTGRVILVPGLNYPAFAAGTRTSPIDKGNMNRVFPGKPEGTATEKIADYVSRTLVPMADIVVDIHSGGKTLDFLPFAAAHVLDDAALRTRYMSAMRSFSAPYSVLMREIDGAGMFDAMVEAQGKTVITTELGGGGGSTARSNLIAKRGVRNVLIHAGILRGLMDEQPSQLLHMPSDDCFIFAEHQGLFEICADLGAWVNKGDVLAKVWSLERTGAAPAVYSAKIPGLVAGRHLPGLIKTGDCMIMLAVA